MRAKWFLSSIGYDSRLRTGGYRFESYRNYNYGRVAEMVLGSALQKLLHQFESDLDLLIKTGNGLMA